MRLYATAPVLCLFCSRPEAASDVVSDRFMRLAVPDKWLKFRDRRLNRVPEIRPKPSDAAFSTVFSNFHKCRPEVAGDVISGNAVELVCVDVCAKCGDSRLNRWPNCSTLWQAGPF